MSKVRGDPLRVALAHPTRAALVSSLNGVAEMSTVQLQESTGVTRYHLYHHLQQLEKAGVVENHRDQGRARWWRLTGPVEMPGHDNASAAPTADLSVLPAEWGLALALPFTFTPSGLLLIGQPRKRS